MFTGIVRGRYQVVAIEEMEAFRSIKVRLEPSLVQLLYQGSSVSVSGVCLTVTGVEHCVVAFDVMRETLRVTTLGNLKEEMYVNIEPSMDTQSDISGHIVSGHVDTTAEILSIDRPDERNCSIRFSVGDRFGRYIFQKGYIAINGCSLTVGDVERKSGVFWVHLIPETIQRTTFGLLRVGDTVNIEIERQTQIIVDTINETLERFLEHRLK